MKLQASSQYELMWQVAQVIKPEDFPQGVLSYFTFEERDGFFHMQKNEKTYTDEMLFMEEVSSKIAGRTIYGFVSYLNSELLLGFRGRVEICAFDFIEGQWKLAEYDDFALREESLAFRRFKISSSWEELKKALS